MDRVQIGDRKTALILAVRENHYEGLFLCQNAKTLFLKLHQPFAPLLAQLQSILYVMVQI